VKLCESCGANPFVSPASGAELPIVAGALDAQAKAESECFRLQTANAKLFAENERLRVEGAGLRTALQQIIAIFNLSHQ